MYVWPSEAQSVINPSVLQNPKQTMHANVQENTVTYIPYSWKIWQAIKFGGLVVYLYRTAKFKSANIFVMAILGPTAKYNSHQYFQLYSTCNYVSKYMHVTALHAGGDTHFPSCTHTLTRVKHFCSTPVDTHTCSYEYVHGLFYLHVCEQCAPKSPKGSSR